jgi:hypothetical protein
MSKEQQELVGDVYKSYQNKYYKGEVFGHKKLNDSEYSPDLKLSQEEFIDKCKTNPDFSEKWGLKIEERELSLEERFNIRYPGGRFSIFQENYPNTHRRNNPNDLLDVFNVPTKLITITYNDKKIESYE